VVTSSDATINHSGSSGTCSDEQVPGTVYAPLQDPPARTEDSHGPAAGAVDFALSGRVGVVDRGNVCSLVAGCLQGVCFTVLHTLTFVVLLLTLGCF
jgi:hypothetical protein